MSQTGDETHEQNQKLNMVSKRYPDSAGSGCCAFCEFRFYMGLRLANAEDAEPSDLVLIMRRVSWVILPCVIIFIYITGLGVL